MIKGIDQAAKNACHVSINRNSQYNEAWVSK